MKICINVLDLGNHLGGIGWYCFHLIKYLKKLYPSLEITLLTHRWIAPKFYPLKEYAAIEEIALKHLWLKIIYFQVIFPFLVRKRFDLLHSAGNIGMIACPIPQIITIHDTYEKVCSKRFGIIKRTLMGFMISFSGRNSAGIITNSKNTCSDVVRFYPHLRHKTQVIYLGNRFASIINPVYKPNNQFLFVGTIEPGKNLITIIKALALFIKKYPEINLKVIGAHGWKQSSLYKLIEKFNISKNVIFVGYVSNEQLKTEYQSSYALICASLYEGFGLPIIEALACGCPVIAAKNSAIVEAGDDCAVYFETENENDLLDKMLYVYSNPQRIHSNIISGLLHAAQFRWEKTAQETYDFYLTKCCLEK
jgi:glycosyltransferase involved in cell wall biosynthesis